MSSARCTRQHDAPHGNDTHHGKIYLRGGYYQPRTSTDKHGNSEYISFLPCSSVRFSGRTIPAEVCLSAGDITNHGRPRTSTETRNIYPFFRVVPCGSVVKSSPRFRGRNSSLLLFLPKGYRRDAEGLTKMTYQSN